MNLDTFKHAVDGLRRSKKLHLILTQISMYRPAVELETLSYTKEAEINFSLTVKIDHESWNEILDIDYVVFESDIITDKIDKLIDFGKAKSQDDLETLRAAWTIWNGYKYAVDHEQEKRLIEAGWHPRVIRTQMRY